MSNFFDKKLNELLDLEADDTAPEKQKKERREGGNAPEAPPQEKFGLSEFVAAPLELAELNDEQNKSDKELARASIRNVLLLANANLDAILQLARATEHPRAFEVAAQFAKTIIDAAGKLDDVTDGKATKSQGNGGNSSGNPQYNQQNNIYMSTEDAMKMLRNMPITQPASPVEPTGSQSD